MTSKRVNALIATLRAKGANVEPRGQRWVVTAPGKPLVFLPTVDPRERRGLDNKITDLRRKGYDV